MALGSEGSSSYSYLLLCGVSRTSMTLLLHTRNLTSAVTEQREPCRVGGGGGGKKGFGGGYPWFVDGGFFF